ncbi:DUF6214 family protein [Streptomyces sp. NPDC057555]|uniref:DUF6214 family protein n=1 Tax=Streptomyces sp. NPDC057555 TaxID=3346166 RepID=UPI0036CBB5E9
MEWPDWELQAHGSAAPELGPWFSARLTFPQGARIDVLVTASGDHLTVEDVRADPPLTPDALAALARWIEGPLDDACRVATGRPPKIQSAPEAPAASAGPESAPTPAAPAGGEGPARSQEARERTAAPAADVVHGEGTLCGTGTGGDAEPAPGTPADAAGPTDAVDARDTADGVIAEGPPSTASGDESPGATGADELPGAAPAATGDAVQPGAAAPATVLVRSRAGERRKLAAAVYRAAQEEGRDPVLAVMHATGRNRRRALRLIAGARDAGLLTPRHHRR